MKFQIALLIGLACSALATPIVDPKVFSALETKDTVNVLISFKNSNTERVRNTFRSVKTTLSTRGAQVTMLYNLLKDQADTVQENVLNFLEKTRSTKTQMTVRQAWINGKIIVKGIDKATILALQSMDEIKEIEADRLIPLNIPVVHKDAVIPLETQWGVRVVRAEEVWNTTGGNNGKGVVVATIDTGVRGTHEALRDNQRAVNSWYDPAEGDKTPTDNQGHGTHTMGTICGRMRGVGVAPGAEWISCKACGIFGCFLTDLTDCGQFALCPTDADGNNPNCFLAPNLVSNSWGGGQADDFYDEIIKNWAAVNIAPLFSMGNSGSTCGTANSPGDSALAIGIGSTTENEEISSFSSRGPSQHGDGRQKPDISAPGSAVVSSYSDSDNSYASLSGTSMACPHVAGIAALAYGENLSLTYEQIRDILHKGVVQDLKCGSQTCEGKGECEFPNFTFGHGRSDALSAFRLAQESRKTQ